MLGGVEIRPLAELGELMQGLPSRFNTREALEKADGSRAHLVNIGDLRGLAIEAPHDGAVNLPADTPHQYFLRDDDVLITTRTRPPRAAVVTTWMNNVPMVPTQNLALLRPNPSIVYGPYLATYLNTPDAIAELEQRYSQSSTIPLLSKRNLETVPIPLPPLPVQHQIAGMALSFEAEERAVLAELEERRLLVRQAIRQATQQ